MSGIEELIGGAGAGGAGGTAGTGAGAGAGASAGAGAGAGAGAAGAGGAGLGTGAALTTTELAAPGGMSTLGGGFATAAPTTAAPGATIGGMTIPASTGLGTQIANAYNAAAPYAKTVGTGAEAYKQLRDELKGHALSPPVHPPAPQITPPQFGGAAQRIPTPAQRLAMILANQGGQ